MANRDWHSTGLADCTKSDQSLSLLLTIRTSTARMRYFTYMAEQAFKTSPEGERLFYQGGPWSRPYIIPDEATEQRLYNKQLWMMRVLLGGLIFGQPILFSYLSDLLNQPLVFLSYFLGVIAIYYLAAKAIFASDLRSLKRL